VPTVSLRRVAAFAVLMVAASAAWFAQPLTARSAASTQLVATRPTTARDVPQPGYAVVRRLEGGTCEAGSEVVQGAYRCFAGNDVVDPCWEDDTGSPTSLQVVCQAEPWKHTLTTISLDSVPPYSGPGGSFTWGVQLATGQRCLAEQGANSMVDGYGVAYACGTDSKLVLVLPLGHRIDKATPIWRIREAHLNASASGYTLAGTVGISVAWHGLPSGPGRWDSSGP
jgi:hypothetical protein